MDYKGLIFAGGAFTLGFFNEAIQSAALFLNIIYVGYQILNIRNKKGRNETDTTSGKD